MTARAHYALFALAYAMSTPALFVAAWWAGSNALDQPLFCVPLVLFGVGAIAHGTMLAWAVSKAWRAK